MKIKDSKFLQFNQKTLIDAEFLIHKKLIEEIHLQKCTTWKSKGNSIYKVNNFALYRRSVIKTSTATRMTDG